jgi:hypothetical protein
LAVVQREKRYHSQLHTATASTSSVELDRRLRRSNEEKVLILHRIDPKPLGEADFGQHVAKPSFENSMFADEQSELMTYNVL